MRTDPRIRARIERIRYGREHRTGRTVVGADVDTGIVRCSRGASCLYAETVDGKLVGGLIGRGQPWHLDHRDDGRGYLGASHAKCNVVHGARKRWQQGPGPSKDWFA